jgi:hypothetical protein
MLRLWSSVPKISTIALIVGALFTGVILTIAVVEVLAVPSLTL